MRTSNDASIGYICVREIEQNTNVRKVRLKANHYVLFG